MLKAIYERIQERLEATGLGAREASRRAGLRPDAIRNIQRAVEEATPGRVGVSTKTIAALAPVLGTTTDWLLEGASAAGADRGLMLVDWADVDGLVDLHRSAEGVGKPFTRFGLWPASHFVTRTPDESMNRLSPPGSYILVDRSDRSLVDGRCYIGILDGCAVFRRWAAEPPRAEPASSDPIFKTEYLNPSREWGLIGRVLRTSLDL